jgi:hypothetical protein
MTMMGGGLGMNSINPGMTPSPFTVILRPPKDLAVLSFDEALQHRMTMMGGGLGMNSNNPGMTPSPFYCHPEASEGPGCFVF